MEKKLESPLENEADLPNRSEGQFVLGSCPTGILSGTNPPWTENWKVRLGFAQQEKLTFW